MTEFIFQHIAKINLEEDVEFLRVMVHPMRLKIVNEFSK